jgi:serine/threonine protein kinase/predicted ATPase
MSVAFGRYRLLERLGQGGMAEVYKAKSFGVEGFEKILVIKRILPELAKSAVFVDMFIHEAKLAVRLSHANIVQVFDLGIAPVEDGGKVTDAYFMAMEYVHGLDLATLLARSRRAQKPLPIDMAVFVAAEVAKGLDHAHRRRDEQLRPLGIVHRDVSPQNVLLSFEGEVKVTDFGIAKARGALEQEQVDDTKARRLHGKFAYMSPEQARGEEVDARSDLFSLGIVLYECIAGVNPVTAPTTFETLRRVQACEYPPVELLRPDVPAELVAILKTAMAKDRKDRYADAGRMYEALLAFLYAQGSRFSAHDLSELLVEHAAAVRDEGTSSSLPARIDEPSLEEHGTMERTPVEVPPSRAASSVQRYETGTFAIAIDKAAGVAQRREVTALVLELPRGAGPDVVERAAQLIERYGGRVLTRDEQIAALFGLGEPDARDTEVATRCGLVVLRTFEGPRRASAGLHTARILVTPEGEPVDDERLAGLLASARDLARAREGRVAVSGAAQRQLKGLFVFEPIVDAEHPVALVAGSLVKDVRPQEATAGRFVGRKDELRRIGEVLASATKRTRRALTIRGGHGIGKTRLLQEVERRLVRGGYNVGWYMAACPPRGREFPLSGIVAMLQVLCGVSEGDSHERVLEVQPRLRALGLHDDEVAAILVALGAKVPAPANAKSALQSAFARAVASLCEDKPHTFAWDAAHCMDEDSFALLDAAYARLEKARVVFAFTAREGFSHPLERAEGHTALDLAELRPEEVGRLLGLRLGTETVPEELVRFVRERAGGHPLFIEEVVKALVDAGAVRVADGRVVSMRLLGLELGLPKTLRGLVASRVSRLSSEERAVLQAAAVLGDPIDSTVLSLMLGEPLATLERTLGTLEGQSFLHRVGPKELVFASPIVREVVADALPAEAAREMHAAAGHALEAQLGEKAHEQAARIATHYYECGDREQAATHFARSADRRVEARQLEAATRDYARAIELCDVDQRPPEELLRWLERLSTTVRLVRQAPEAQELCERVLGRLDRTGDAALRVRGRVNAARILTALHKFEQAVPMLAEAEKIADGDEKLLEAVLVTMAEHAARRGDFARSLELLERLQKLSVREGDVQEQHKLLLNLAQAHAATGNRQQAFQALEQAEQLLPDDLAAQCERQKLRGLVHYFSNEYREAALESEKAVDLARSLGLTYEVAVNLHNVGDVLCRLEDHARAYGAIQQSTALCDESGFERLGSQNRMYLAYLAGLRGDKEAEQRLLVGIRYAQQNDYVWDVINGRWLLAELHRRTGKMQLAREEFALVRDLAKASGHVLAAEDCEEALAALASAPPPAAEAQR